MKVADGTSSEMEKTFQCPFCPFSTNSTNSNLKIHIQNIHYEIKHTCEQCDMQFNTKQILAKHIARLHKRKLSFCDQCSYSTAEMTKMREHKRVKHEGIWYKCDQCDYQSPNRTGLKKHDNIKHKGLQPSFKCEFCSHIATERGNLRQHVRSKHEHVKETCSAFCQCFCSIGLCFLLPFTSQCCRGDDDTNISQYLARGPKFLEEEIWRRFLVSFSTYSTNMTTLLREPIQDEDNRFSRVKASLTSIFV